MTRLQAPLPVGDPLGEAERTRIELFTLIDTHNFVVDHVRTHLWSWSWKDFKGRRKLRHALRHLDASAYRKPPK